MPLRVGLTGGIGSGKSEVARIFAALGAVVIDADALARDALAPGTSGFARVAARWPQAVAGDALDRAALGRIVFADRQARAELNAIVHPEVRSRAAALEAGAPADRIVVHDIPLLFETGLESGFDASVLVVAPTDVRLARVAARSGLSADDARSRMAAQIDPAIARTRATLTVENDGTLDDLETRAREAFALLASLPPRPERSAPF